MRSVIFNKDFDENCITLKCIVVGEPAVGKTTALSMLSDGIYDREHLPTIGIDLKVVYGTIYDRSDTTVPTVPTQKYRLQMWDCAGQIRYRSIVTSYYRMAQLVVIMFDVTDRDTFASVKEWYTAVSERLNPGTYLCYLIGNKSDMKRQRVVSEEEGIEAANSMGCQKYFEISAQKHLNLYSAFETIIIEAHDAIERKFLVIPKALQPTEKLTASSPPSGCGCHIM
jgi:small GTP-binding protein